jgi:hypothetical protein
MKRDPSVLAIGPNPTPCPRAHTTEAVRRKLHCRRYDQCLDHADASGWENFTCRRCDVDEEISHEQHVHDAEGMALFLREYVGPRADRLSEPKWWVGC